MSNTSPTRRCQELARRLLKLIEENGQTLKVAHEIDLLIERLLCEKPKGAARKEWDENVYYLGLIEAKGALVLPAWILYYQQEGRSPEEIRESFPKYEMSLSEGWAKCLLALGEIAGDVKPNRFWERDRAKWIRHWRSLWECNRRNEAAGLFYPENTATDEAIIQTALEEYPDLDLKEITG